MTQNTEKIDIDWSDISDASQFMDALLTFLHEGALCVQEVKQRAGITPGCNTSVPMNDEEKQEKLSSIVSSLGQTFQAELSKVSSESKSTTPASSQPIAERRAESPRTQSAVRGKVPGQFYSAGVMSQSNVANLTYTVHPGYATTGKAPKQYSSSGYSSYSLGDSGCAPACPSGAGGRMRAKDPWAYNTSQYR